MRLKFIATALLLACASCSPPAPMTSGPMPNPATPNGDVVSRPGGLAPDTPPGAKTAAKFKDKAIDTDPSSPRFQDKGQKVQAPLVTQ